MLSTEIDLFDAFVSAAIEEKSTVAFIRKIPPTRKPLILKIALIASFCFSCTSFMGQNKVSQYRHYKKLLHLARAKVIVILLLFCRNAIGGVFLQIGKKYLAHAFMKKASIKMAQVLICSYAQSEMAKELSEKISSIPHLSDKEGWLKATLFIKNVYPKMINGKNISSIEHFFQSITSD
ncbi:MAG: hypothetical protein ACOVOR_03115 [Rhabdochlamydiaceae bacterium]